MAIGNGYRGRYIQSFGFLHIAQGSLRELDTQLELSRRLEFIDEDTWKWLDDKLIEEDKVLSGLIRSQKEAM